MSDPIYLPLVIDCLPFPLRFEYLATTFFGLDLTHQNFLIVCFFINLFHFSSLEKIYAVLWKLYGFTSSIYSLFRLTKLSMNYLVFDEAEETWLRCESSLFM